MMKDGTYYADVNKPDMHGPIAYALYEGKAPFEVRTRKGISRLWRPIISMAFDPERYPLRQNGDRKALAEGGIETDGSQRGQ
jgi:1-deoxy-D-xylulose 5-phosphate reductoisomerase